jgi:hypothetical protein
MLESNRLFTARVMNQACASLLAIALAGCTSSHKNTVSDVATSPLRDLNVVHAKIPKVLADARQRPYADPADTSCESLSADVKALDEVLGPDIDVPSSNANPSLLERGTTAAGNEAVGAMKGAAEDVVPFRHWVRQLSGAERYSKKVAAAIIAGTVRRSFLKGIGVAHGCTWPPNASQAPSEEPPP